MFTFGLAAAVFVVFLAGVVREPRSFGNAVLLGLALALGALGLADHLAGAPGRPEHLVLFALLLAVAFGPFLIGCFLLVNGVIMIRRESLRPGNLLSLLAGAVTFIVIGLDIVADRVLREDRSRNTEENLLFSKAIMDQLRPGARATIVTSDFHAFRAALLARRLGMRAQVTGARVAGYYEPTAVLREFAAVFLRYRIVNLGICAVLVVVPLGVAAVRYLT